MKIQISSTADLNILEQFFSSKSFKSCVNLCQGTTDFDSLLKQHNSIVPEKNDPAVRPDLYNNTDRDDYHSSLNLDREQIRARDDNHERRDDNRSVVRERDYNDDRAEDIKRDRNEISEKTAKSEEETVDNEEVKAQSEDQKINEAEEGTVKDAFLLSMLSVTAEDSGGEENSENPEMSETAKHHGIDPVMEDPDLASLINSADVGEGEIDGENGGDLEELVLSDDSGNEIIGSDQEAGEEGVEDIQLNGSEQELAGQHGSLNNLDSAEESMDEMVEKGTGPSEPETLDEGMGKEQLPGKNEEAEPIEEDRETLASNEIEGNDEVNKKLEASSDKDPNNKEVNHHDGGDEKIDELAQKLKDMAEKKDNVKADKNDHHIENDKKNDKDEYKVEITQTIEDGAGPEHIEPGKDFHPVEDNVVLENGKTRRSSQVNAAEIRTEKTVISKTQADNPGGMSNNNANNSHIAQEGVKSGARLFSANAVRESGFNEILDKITYLSKNNNRLGVTLEHEKFGRLNINLSVKEGLVNVRINTNDNAVREFVQSHMSYIVDSLSEEGLNVGGFSVALKNQKQHNENFSPFMDNGKARDYEKNRESEPVQINDKRGLVNVFV